MQVLLLLPADTPFVGTFKNSSNYSADNVTGDTGDNLNALPEVSFRVFLTDLA